MIDCFIGELFDSVYSRIIKIGIINPLNTITDIIMYAVGDFFNTNLNEYVERYVADPKFWAGIGGGLLFDAGKIAIFTGVGAPVGLALMGVGTFFTAYSCGLFDMDSEGNYVGLTGENMGNFAFQWVVILLVVVMQLMLLGSHLRVWVVRCYSSLLKGLFQQVLMGDIIEQCYVVIVK